MPTKKNYFQLFAIASAALLVQSGSEANAQRRPFQIGGSQGVVIGGGMGLRIGGSNGVQFGGGQGARFGPPATGVQFGGGQGARFGPTQTGVQFGGGQGAKFGALQFGGRGNVAPGSSNAMPAGRNVQNFGGANNRKVVRADSDASKPIEYSLNGTPFQLRPGSETVLQFNQQWTLAYSPGPGLEEREVQIEEPGIYVFTETESGWDLVVDDASSQDSNPVNSPTPAVASPQLEGPILAPIPTDESILAPTPTDVVPKPVESIPARSKKSPTPTEDVPAPTKQVLTPTKELSKSNEQVPAEKTETRQSKSILEWKSSTPTKKDK